MPRLGGAECGDFIPLAKPVIDAGLQHRAPRPRAQTLAMNDPYATKAHRMTLPDEVAQGDASLLTGHAVKIDFFLDRDLPASKLP